MSMAIGGAGMSSLWLRQNPFGGGRQGATQRVAAPEAARQGPAPQDAAKRGIETPELRSKRLGQGCQTCATRKYQDGSNDPGVSFQSPTAIRPEMAGAAVMGHEQEHVTREQQKAGREGREVVGQSVTLHLGLCGECKRPYVAGGTTRTTTAVAKARYSQAQNALNAAPQAFFATA